MKFRLTAITAFLVLSFSITLFISCGGGDSSSSSEQSDDNSDDTQTYAGDCTSYCDKAISCGDPSWPDTEACAQNCESAPKRDCLLSCDPSLSCGDFFGCLSTCPKRYCPRPTP
jgi:hypothetical protein